MSWLKLAIAVAAALIASQLPFVSHARFQTSETQTKTNVGSLAAVPGEILVRFRGQEAASKNDGLLVADHQAGGITLSVERLRGPEIIPGLRIARVHAGDTHRALEALRARPDVVYAEPNFIRRKDAVPNDSMYGDLWGLKNAGQNGGVSGVDIKAEDAWNITTGTPNVVVAIIDEGIDISHPDLQPNIWQNAGEVAGNATDDDGNGFIDDRNGFDFVSNDGTVYDGPGVNPDDSPIDAHGTHVAGTIGALGNNGLGVVGVNWNASLMSLKALGPNGATTADLVEAYGYAKMMRDRWVNTSGAQGANIRVTNNSYGGDGYSQAEADAISAMGTSGILFVASAGNDGRDANIIPSFPANYDLPNVIAVASIERTGAKSGFSNYSSRLVHIGAPGGSVKSTMPQNSYGFANGTSMASPHVAGIAALVLAAHPNFSLSRLRAATLFGGTSTIPMEQFTVTGRLASAFGSLQNASEVDSAAPAPFSDLQIGAQDGRTVVLQWTATGDDGTAGQASLIEVRYFDAVTNAHFLLNVIKPPVAGTPQTLSVNIPYQHANGSIRLTAIDNAGNFTETNIAVAVNAETIDPYSVTVGPTEPLSVGGVGLGYNFDDFVTQWSLPFSFPFYDRFYNQLSVSSNGAIYFGSQPIFDAVSASSALNGRLMIAGLWDDIDLRKCVRADSDVYRVTPDSDRVIYRWQGVKFTSPDCPSSPGNVDPVNFEIELRRDGNIKLRYGQNTPLRPVVGIGPGEPEGYLISSHTSEASPKDLSNAQSVQFSLRKLPPVADLAILSVTSPTIAQVGDHVSFDLTVTNRGPSRTSSIVVTDNLPGGSNFISCTTAQGTCLAANNGSIQINVPLLEVNASTTIRIVVQATSSSFNPFINRVSVKGAHTDLESSNNEASSVCQLVTPNINPQLGLVAISASGHQSFAIRSDRYGLAWGHNSHGQLGDGSLSNKSLPVRISGISSIASIDGGLFHTLALRQDGSVWAWGNNDKGQLGDGTTVNHRLPAKITSLSNVIGVSGGGGHSMALRADGTVWVWGDNSAGQLGDGSTTGSSTPKQVQGLTGVRYISAGVDHSLAVKTDGTVWAWGGNESGQLGDSTTTGRTTPVQVTGLSDISSVSAGEGFSFFGPNGLTNVTFSVALKSDGTVWTWGHNWRGQLGDGTVINKSTPGKVAGLTGVSAIAAGGFHVLALRNDGTVWTWGGNFDGQLGDTTLTDKLSPVKVVWLSGIQSIAAGSQHSLALRQDGHAFGWGSYTNGQLGFGGTVGSLVYPYEVSAQIPDPPPIGIVSTPTFSPSGGTFPAALSTTVRSTTGDLTINNYFTGGGHNFFRLSDGSFYAWGNNSHGQLGIDPGYPMVDPNKAIFKTAVSVTGLDGVLALSPGQNHNVILKTDGTVWTSGGNTQRQLGYETNFAPRAAFGQVPGLSSVAKVAAGFDRSVALKTDGTVWAWGAGPINNDSSSIFFPTQVNGLSNVKDVTCGAAFFAILNDGTLWAWGSNYQGVLGDGTETHRPVPVHIAGVNNTVAVASGASHTVTLKSDGTVWTWGNNSSGQLGLGDDFSAKLSPVQVPGLSNVVAIAAGVQFTLALKSDGTVWAWGENFNSQLGDGTTIQRRSPVQVVGLTNITSIKAGYRHSLARTADGRLFSWGANDQGQLGTGHTENQSTPIELNQLTGGVSIHYSTDGSEPTEDHLSLVSGASFPVNQTVVIKARAFKSGWTPSAVSTASFTISPQGAETVQLTAATFSSNESDNKATVTIMRSGNTTTAASVDFATSDTAALTECNVVNGIASSRCDYATSIGTVNFAAGEASKTIFIPIVNDGYAEGNETFSITLSNPVGATLGSFTTANVTIQDNESSNSANPIDQVDFFIEQHYIDFLGRNAEPAGLAGWRNVLNNCGITVAQPCDRIEVSAGFFRSPEFQSRGYFIYRFYSSVGAIPLYDQFMPDFAKVSGFLSDAQLEANKVAFVNEFMARSVFQNKYSSTFNNPTAYVDALLATVGLPAHPSRQTWINQLTASNTTDTRGQVLRALVESQQVYDKYYREAFVIMQYFGYLRRTADASYVNWINTMNQTNGDYRIMINGFMNSAEYRRRFGP